MEVKRKINISTSDLPIEKFKITNDVIEYIHSTKKN